MSAQRASRTTTATPAHPSASRSGRSEAGTRGWLATGYAQVPGAARLLVAVLLVITVSAAAAATNHTVWGTAVGLSAALLVVHLLLVRPGVVATGVVYLLFVLVSWWVDAAFHLAGGKAWDLYGSTVPSLVIAGLVIAVLAHRIHAKVPGRAWVTTALAYAAFPASAVLVWLAPVLSLWVAYAAAGLVLLVRRAGAGTGAAIWRRRGQRRAQRRQDGSAPVAAPVSVPAPGVAVIGPDEDQQDSRAITSALPEVATSTVSLAPVSRPQGVAGPEESLDLTLDEPHIWQDGDPTPEPLLKSTTVDNHVEVGQQVSLMTDQGMFTGFRVVSRPIVQHDDVVTVDLCTEAEWQRTQVHGGIPDRVPYPLASVTG